jgi:hypothetical protein
MMQDLVGQTEGIHLLIGIGTLSFYWIPDHKVGVVSWCYCAFRVSQAIEFRRIRRRQLDELGDCQFAFEDTGE